MRNFLLLRRPLPRRTLVFCHVVAQLTLVIAGLAWLAMRTVHGLSGNVPAVTGARESVALGGIYQAAISPE